MALADRILQLKLVTDTRGVSKDMGKAQKATAKMGASFKKMGAVIGGAFAGLAVLDFLKTGVDDALAMESAMRKLQGTTENMGRDWDKVGARIDAALSEMERLNFDDIAAAGDLNALIVRFGDVGKAIRVMRVAGDVAARLFEGDLSKGISTVTKALDGNVKALRILGVPKRLWEKGPQAILRFLKRDFAGAAEEGLGTVQGKIATFMTWLGNQGEAIGAALLTWIDPVATFITEDLLPKFEELRTTLGPHLENLRVLTEQILAPLVDFLKRDGNAAAVALTAIAVALGLFLVPAAAFAIKVVIVTVAITALIVAITTLIDKMPEIQRFFQDLIDTITGKTGEASTASRGFADAMFTPIEKRAQEMKQRVTGQVEDVIDAYTRLRAILQATRIPGIGRVFSVIPRLADGAVVTRPTLAMVGERGPEAVVPLNRAGGMGATIIVNTGVGDPVEIGREVDRVLRAYRGRSGLAA